MLRKGLVLVLCLCLCVVLGGSQTNTVNNEESSKNTRIEKEKEEEEENFSFDEEDSDDDVSNVFNNMINTDDIKSIDDITDDMILNKEGAYFNHSQTNKKGDNLELDFEGFTGVYKWCDLEADQNSSITVHIEGAIDKNSRLVLIQNDKSIQDIKDGEEIALDKGKSRIVLCGYNANGNLKLSLTYDKNKISIPSSIF